MKNLFYILFLVSFLTNCASMKGEFEDEFENSKTTKKTETTDTKTATTIPTKTDTTVATKTDTGTTADSSRNTTITTGADKTTKTIPSTTNPSTSTTSNTNPEKDTKVAINNVEKTTTTIPKAFDLWTFQGWGGSPSDLNAKLESAPMKNWYYKKYSSNASKTAVESKSPSFMESTCKLSAIQSNKQKIFSDVYNSSLPKDKLKEGMKIPSIESNDVQSVACKPTDEKQSFASCECILFVKIDGGKDSVLKMAESIQ